MARHRIQEFHPLPPLDERAYDGHEEWTNKRWAWEFLRRNVKFREACDGLDKDSTPAKKTTIAKKFGLARFKHYSEPYDSDDGTFTAPMFRSKAVVTIRPSQNDKGRWLQSVVVMPDQIAIRFDLRLAVSDDRILDEQLKTARDILQKQLVKWREIKGLPPKKKGRNRKRAKLLEELKILDSLGVKAIHAQRANLIWGHDMPEKKFIDAQNGAVETAQKGYLELAAIGDKKPTTK